MESLIWCFVDFGWAAFSSAPEALMFEALMELYFRV